MGRPRTSCYHWIIQIRRFFQHRRRVCVGIRSGDGNDLHDQKRQCVRIVKTRVEIALSNNEFLPVISSNTINSSSINRIVTPYIMSEMSSGCGDMVEEATCDADMDEPMLTKKTEVSGVVSPSKHNGRIVDGISYVNKNGLLIIPSTLVILSVENGGILYTCKYASSYLLNKSP